MRLLSSAVIGCAADLSIRNFNAGELNLLFLRAGLGDFAPGSAYGKSALVSSGITPALQAANAGDEGAKDGLNKFVLLVAEQVAPRFGGSVIEAGSDFWKLREAARSDGFELEAEFTSGEEDGALVGVRLLPLDEPTMPLSAEITALEADFTDLGLSVALNHYRQAVTNFVEQNFEAANGQLRAMLESVIIHFAVTQGFTQTRQGDGGRAIAHLRDNGHLPEREGGDLVRGLWWMTHTNGPHPGTTTSGEVHFRMQTMTAVAPDRPVSPRCPIDRGRPGLQEMTRGWRRSGNVSFEGETCRVARVPASHSGRQGLVQVERRAVRNGVERAGPCARRRPLGAEPTTDNLGTAAQEAVSCALGVSPPGLAGRRLLPTETVF
ncbi:hypothetical protein [Spirillospora sp. NPDC048819]|uniref:hypothetical protein n=1 Tax=Spirillospora sp. NPDC048819 TaxID=3155268 RepID=UPI003406BBE9